MAASESGGMMGVEWRLWRGTVLGVLVIPIALVAVIVVTVVTVFLLKYVMILGAVGLAAAIGAWFEIRFGKRGVDNEIY